MKFKQILFLEMNNNLNRNIIIAAKNITKALPKIKVAQNGKLPSFNQLVSNLNNFYSNAESPITKGMPLENWKLRIQNYTNLILFYFLFDDFVTVLQNQLEKIIKINETNKKQEEQETQTSNENNVTEPEEKTAEIVPTVQQILGPANIREFTNMFAQLFANRLPITKDVETQNLKTITQGLIKNENIFNSDFSIKTSRELSKLTIEEIMDIIKELQTSIVSIKQIKNQIGVISQDIYFKNLIGMPENIYKQLVQK